MWQLDELRLGLHQFGCSHQHGVKARVDGGHTISERRQRQTIDRGQYIVGVGHLHLGCVGEGQFLGGQQAVALLWLQLLPVGVGVQARHAVLVAGLVFGVQPVQFVADQLRQAGHQGGDGVRLLQQLALLLKVRDLRHQDFGT